MTKIHGILEALYSERDQYGNCYWALRYTDTKTGRVVEGTVSGGESNIHAVRQGFNKVDGWDAGILFRTVPLKKREFKRLTAKWEYAGCGPDELAKYIKEGLKT